MYQFLFNELRTRSQTVIDCCLNNDHSDAEQESAMLDLTRFVEALDTIFLIDEEDK